MKPQLILEADSPEPLDTVRQMIERWMHLTDDQFPPVRVVAYPAVLIKPEKENQTK